MENPIEIAAHCVGSYTALAKALGVTKSAVGQWKLADRQVPVEHCPVIEALTNKTVTRRDLRPNDWWRIWPELVTRTDASHLAPHKESGEARSVRQ